MLLYTSDKTSPRSFPWLWYIRLVAIVITLVVLGITAGNTATFHNTGCNAPARLLYNLAVSVISFVALIYFILASGPSPATRLLPWFIWGQLALDAIVFVLWLSAGATSSYSCLDLCNVCGIPNGYVYFDSQACACYDDLFFKRDYSPKPRNVLIGRGTDSTVGGSIAAKQAFDAIMTVIFAIFIALDIFWIFKTRNAGATTGATPTNGPPMKSEEAGMPLGGVGAPTYTQPSNSEYNSQMAPQGGYAGQQMQQQGGAHQQPMPQESHPINQYPQGQNQYPQGQSQYPPNQPQYPDPASYHQGQQVSSQSYSQTQGEYPPQYGSPVLQQASYHGPPDGVSEMHSPTQAPKMNDPPHV